MNENSTRSNRTLEKGFGEAEAMEAVMTTIEVRHTSKDLLGFCLAVLAPAGGEVGGIH
jgi:hypothetical protein